MNEEQKCKIKPVHLKYKRSIQVLAVPCEMFGERQLEEVEGHIYMVGAQAQLLGERHDLLSRVFQRNLPRLPPYAGGKGSADTLTALSVRGDEGANGGGTAVGVLLKLDV